MDKNIAWKLFRFEELTADTLYNILELRCKIFIVEQACAYLDIDNKDRQAWHLCGYCDGRLVAYCRLFKAGGYYKEASIGRVIVDKQYRAYGFGKDLLQTAIHTVKTVLKETEIKIAAQLYLKRFYESFGFLQISAEYLEDGIPHIDMKYKC